jgi:hypothetical protein
VACLAVLGTGVLTACLADSPTGSQNQERPVGVSVTLPRSIAGPQSPGSAFSVVMTEGENELVMERIELVIRDLRLKPDDVSTCGAGECVEYVGGPVLLPLPTGGETVLLATRSVPLKRFDRLDLSLDPPGAGEQVLEENPELEGVSVRVEGTYNDEPFTYTGDVAMDARMDLSPALVLGEGPSTANVTFLVGVTGWFRNSLGLIDPRTANEGGENEDVVDSNIRESFEAFRDDDRDGSRGTGGG